MINKENKITLKAKLFPAKLTPEEKKEIASRIPLPKDNKQIDLMYMSAILVSTGTNKNGATFLGSELVQAKDTIADKALNIEHTEDKVVGHIKSAVFLDQSGNLIDSESAYSELASASDDEKCKIIAALDLMDMDIGIVCVVHKHRFKDLSEEIEEGQWHVSMECYYDDFDLKVGDVIIPKEKSKEKLQELTKTGDLTTANLVKLVVSGKSLGNKRVSRVLRGIKFCGVGLVKNPANPRSVVDETAKEKFQVSKERFDASNILSLFKEAAGEVRLQDTEESPIKYLHLPEDDRKEIILENCESKFIVVSSEKVIESGSFVSAAEGEEVYYTNILKSAIYLNKEDATKLSIKATTLTGVKHYITEIVKETSVNTLEKFKEENFNKGFTLLETDKAGKVLNIMETEKGSFIGRPEGGGSWGPNDNAAGICIDFAKYYYEFDRSPNPGRLIGVHWCKLFDQPCPVIGADALAKECLRNKFSRLTKDDNIHFNATKPTVYNPRSITPTEDLVFIPATDQPKVDPRSGDPEFNEKYGERFIPGVPEFDGDFKRFPVADLTVRPEGVEAPKHPNLIVEDRVTEYDPGIEEFMSLLSEAASKVDKALNRTLTIESKSKLPKEYFAVPEKKELPLHNLDAVEKAIKILSTKISKALAKEKNVDLATYLQPHARVLKKALILGIEVSDFESLIPYEAYNSDEGVNYGIPRLKLFPLDSKQATIAAMSRYTSLKKDITVREKDILFCKIVRAARKFGINPEGFIKKFR